jgi:hypothetical protein
MAAGAARYGVDPYVAGLAAFSFEEMFERSREGLFGTLRMMNAACADLSEDELLARTRNATFGELFDAVLPSAMQAHTEERRRQLANILEAGIRADEQTTRRLVVIARLLEEVDEVGILWLEWYSPSEREPDEAKAHEKYSALQVAPLMMNASHEEWVKHHLAHASRERLVSLRLLQPTGWSLPHRTPSFNGNLNEIQNLAAVVRELWEHVHEAAERGARPGRLSVTDTGELLLSVVKRGTAALRDAPKDEAS